MGSQDRSPDVEADTPADAFALGLIALGLAPPAKATTTTWTLSNAVIGRYAGTGYLDVGSGGLTTSVAISVADLTLTKTT